MIKSTETIQAELNSEERLMLPCEVTRLFRVDPKTVTRWAKAGKLSCIRTLGGHRRFKEKEVMFLLNGSLEEKSDGS